MAAPPRVFWTRRLQLLALLSVPSGMPLGWVFNAFQYFLVDLGVSRAEIGFLSGVSLPWTLKFLWAPLVDRFAVPWLGRRRGWMVATQLLLAFTFGVIATFAAKALAARGAGTPLASAAVTIGVLAFVVAFFSATQDIAYDAYAVEFLRPEEHAAAPGLRSAYYQLGFLLAGPAAVSASDLIGWPATFALVALAFVLCVPLVIASPEPERAPVAVRTLREAVIEPFTSYFKRPDAWVLALFLILYKIGDNMAATMVNPFLKDLCFSNTEAGLSVKGIGVAATIVGGLSATGIIRKLGLGRSLWVLGLAQAAASFLYAAAAVSRHAPLDAHLCPTIAPLDPTTHAWAYVAIAGEYGARSMAATAQGALLLRVCDRQNAVTQFALLSSLFAFGRWASGLPSGLFVERLGYPWFFVVCATVMAVPGFVFLQRISPFGSREVTSAPAPQP
jgi:MFS transporter, PAT family, beta-lactamase induction signal transducer AmpG